MKKKYQSEILEVLHGMAEDLHEIGAISDSRMAEYDRDCIAKGTKEARTISSKANTLPEQQPAPVYAGSRQT